MQRRLRHRHRHRGRQDRRRRGDRPHPRRRRAAGRGLQARRHRPRRARRARPRAAAPRRRLRARATRRSPPTATGRPPPPTSPRRWPARRSTRSGCSRRRAPRRASADALVCEGVGGLLVPLAPGYLVRDLAVDLGAAAGRSPPSPGLGTINHTLLTIEAARAAGLDGRGGRAHPLARRAERGRALEPRDDRRARRGAGRDPAAARPRPATGRRIGCSLGTGANRSAPGRGAAAGQRRAATLPAGDGLAARPSRRRVDLRLGGLG